MKHSPQTWKKSSSPAALAAAAPSTNQAPNPGVSLQLLPSGISGERTTRSGSEGRAVAEREGRVLAGTPWFILQETMGVFSHSSSTQEQENDLVAFLSDGSPCSLPYAGAPAFSKHGIFYLTILLNPQSPYEG